MAQSQTIRARQSRGIDVQDIDRWWRAANYLSAGQIYLRDNPLLARPIRPGDIKRRLLGHWGTNPGINLVWAHVNRIIIERDVSTIFICGPGHGGPAAIANPWLEGTYGEIYPEVGWSVDGLRRLFEQFSFPGGVPSHAAPETPGSIHEGGELGYSLAHAQGASFDAPGDLVVVMIGDGEAETAPLAGSWPGHRFLTQDDGVVLPVLHLNGYKIANPTVFARMPESEVRQFFAGQGYEPWFVSGDEPMAVHEELMVTLDDIADRSLGPGRRNRPVLVLRTPKGWTGPGVIDGVQIEGTFRAHQVPIGHDLGDDRLAGELDRWMRRYRPEELFAEDGVPAQELDRLRPDRDRRMSANPRTNAGLISRPLDLPEPGLHAVDVPSPGLRSAMRALGRYLRDVIEANGDRFRLFGPDEVESNRLDSVFDATGRRWPMDTEEDDAHLSPRGRVMEVLSEHLCQGWLEGYLLTGRHGVFTSYEAFIHIVDSMFNQHAKWLESSRRVEWREPVPSLNYVLSSHVWRQDHNGFSHQDPGFLDVVANKRPDVVRIYLPPDANTLLATMDTCLRSRDLVNLVIAGKQPEPQYLDSSEARRHLERGLSVWDWAGSETEKSPAEVVFASAGDVPTKEALAAARLLAGETDLSVRVVNVVDLFRLTSPAKHPHGMPDEDYDEVFPSDVPTIFAFHGYPWLIHRLTHHRHNQSRVHVHGYDEEGTTTTPFDMLVRNRLDRFHLVLNALDRMSRARQERLTETRDLCLARLEAHATHIRATGEDLPDIDDAAVSRHGFGS